MSLILSAPGKTFLAGEYLAMDGGLALMGMTEPRFELRVRPGAGGLVGISSTSPAGKFCAREKEFFKNFDLEFVDPHEGRGGWGASTAQYLMAFAFKNCAPDEMLDVDLKDLLENYRQDAWDGTGRAPSGADLVGQLKGSLTFFERNAGMTSQSAWPFENLEPYLLKTGVKLPTHEHLKVLAEADFSALVSPMTQIRDAWKIRDEGLFVDGIKSFGRELARKGLIAETTLDVLHDLAWMSGVKAAKGCGAMGADVVFILIEKGFRREFELWAEETDREILRLKDSLSAGLEIKVLATNQAFTEGTL